MVSVVMALLNALILMNVLMLPSTTVTQKMDYVLTNLENFVADAMMVSRKPMKTEANAPMLMNAPSAPTTAIPTLYAIILMVHSLANVILDLLVLVLNALMLTNVPMVTQYATITQVVSISKAPSIVL